MKLNQQALKKLSERCTLCGSQEPPLTTNVIKESETQEIVHVQCLACKGSIIAVLFSSGQTITSVGMLTDLNPAEISLLERSPRINEDDLIDLHKALGDKTICDQLLNEY